MNIKCCADLPRQNVASRVAFHSIFQSLLNSQGTHQPCEVDILRSWYRKCRAWNRSAWGWYALTCTVSHSLLMVYWCSLPCSGGLGCRWVLTSAVWCQTCIVVTAHSSPSVATVRERSRFYEGLLSWQLMAFGMCCPTRILPESK